MRFISRAIQPAVLEACRAPLAHGQLGTVEIHGAVRFSIGPFTTEERGSQVRGFKTIEVHGDGGQVIPHALAAVQAHARDGAQAIRVPVRHAEEASGSGNHHQFDDGMPTLCPRPAR